MKSFKVIHYVHQHKVYPNNLGTVSSNIRPENNVVVFIKCTMKIFQYSSNTLRDHLLIQYPNCQRRARSHKCH